MSAPAGWDGESYCCAEGCMNPATRRIPTDMGYYDGEPIVIVEMVCVLHALKQER